MGGEESAGALSEGPSADQADKNEEFLERPTDDAIIEQQNEIRKQEEERRQFVGNKEPLSVLAEEYERGSTVFQAKIQSLPKFYRSIRRTRGDGNCFFRAFMFAYLEHLLVTNNKVEAKRMLRRAAELKEVLLEQGYTELTFEDFLLSFVEQVESIAPEAGEPISAELLLQRARDPNVSNYVVMFLRFITACEIRRRADFFEPFIMGLSNMTVQQFCASSVEPMGEESDHVHITALTDILHVPVRVVYLDGSSGGSQDSPEVNHHDFMPDTQSSPSQQQVPSIVLLYRPGHYDILYV